MLGEIDDIHAVVAGALATTLVVNTLHAKMDLPLVVLESLLLGVPALVGEGTAAQELSASGGVIALPPGDGAALAEALAALAEDPARRAQLADRGARWVTAECAPSTVAARYERLYDQVLAGR